MTLKEFWRWELHVALHAQSPRFRAVKWTIILLACAGLHAWKGPDVLVRVLVVAGVLAICLHVFVRWKTDGWTKPWGLYKPVPPPGE